MRHFTMIVCLTLGLTESAVPKLRKYNITPDSISVSGISSGAVMASQIHVTHSATIMGVGMIAGVPFACSGGNFAGLGVCMLNPAVESLTAIEWLVASGALVGNVDAPSNMAHDQVYIFSGTMDTIVNPGNGQKIQQFYNHYIPRANIKTMFDIPAQHCMPTESFGATCSTLSPSSGYINDCNFSAAYDLLNHIYGGHLVKPNTDTSISSNLHQFDQTGYMYIHSSSTYMDSIGYVYVPTICARNYSACKLHIALHGCLMGRQKIGEKYVRHAGYNEVAELNNIIIVYPQVISSLSNPTGCWDGWGYTGPLFATKHGSQITAIMSMVNTIRGL